MKRDKLLKEILKQAKIDAQNRLDPRFRQTMGFLVAKGFLRVNFELAKLPNHRICIDDAIWAGQNVEPRILEVLPAAVLRLEKHFDLNPQKHKKLAHTINQLQDAHEHGDDLYGIPYKKIKAWVNFNLPDRRTKRPFEKKIMKTFRLSPKAIELLNQAANKSGRSITEVLEEKIFS